MYVFERGRVFNARCSGCVTARKSLEKLVTAGWNQRVCVCDVATRLVDLGRVATWKVDIGSKNVGHHRYTLSKNQSIELSSNGFAILCTSHISVQVISIHQHGAVESIGNVPLHFFFSNQQAIVGGWNADWLKQGTREQPIASLIWINQSKFCSE